MDATRTTGELIREANARGFSPVVQYVPDGRTAAWWGAAEYVTSDGWVGIRQVGGRLDEAPAHLCVIDPT